MNVAHELAACCTIYGIALICYWNSADGDFVFDDSEAIVGNSDLEADAGVWLLWQHDFWGDPISSTTSHKSYRPLTVLTFQWNTWFTNGDLRPWGFHVANIALHGVCSLLFYALAKKILGTSSARAESIGFDWASFASAALFAVHPVHSESVAAVVGRADLLSALFFFSAVLCYTHACPAPGCLAYKQGRVAVAHPADSSDTGLMKAGHWSWLMLSICLSALAMLCKEQGVTALGIVFIYDLILYCGVMPHHALGALQSKPFRIDLYRWLSRSGFLSRQLVVVGASLACMLVRWRVMGGQAPTFQPLDNPASFANSTLTRLLTYNYIYALNGWLLLCPYWLCFDWAMGCVPLLSSLQDPRCLAVLCFWTISIALLYQSSVIGNGSFSRSWSHRQVLLSLAMLVVPFLPASNVFFRVGFVVAERVLYLPSAGYCLLVVLGAQRVCRLLHRWLSCRSIYVILPSAIMLLLIFIGRSRQRSFEWRREETLFSTGAEVCPLNAKVHYNIGKVNADAGRQAEAIASYREAVRLHENYDQALNNLGNILKDNGELQEAHDLLQRAVTANPKFAAAWMNLGIVKADLKMRAEAEQCYQEAIRHRRKYPDAWYNLGNLYLSDKKFDRAIQAWTNALDLKPTHFGAWHNMALAFEETNRLKEAKALLLESFKVLPNSFDLHLTMANICGKLNEVKESEREFKAAISLASSVTEQANAWGNLGVLYHRAKERSKAEVAYRNAEKLAPGLTAAKANLDMLLKSTTS